MKYSATRPIYHSILCTEDACDIDCGYRPPRDPDLTEPVYGQLTLTDLEQAR